MSCRSISICPLSVSLTWKASLHCRWDEGRGDPGYPHAQIKFSPDWSSFQSDPFYKSRAAAGIKTHVCIEGRPLCQFGGASPNQTIGKWKAVDENADIGTAKTKDPGRIAILSI